MDPIYVSFIVPFYNVEDVFFRRCIDSILPIQIPIEIIVINDGSREVELEPYIEYTSKDKRIQWIHKENGGVSTARNCGMKHARGRYLFFIDGDDEITDEFRQYLEMHICEKDADWILFDSITHDVATKHTFPRRLFPNKNKDISDSSYRIEQDELLHLRVTTKQLCECWGKLIKRESVEKYGIEFPVGVLSGEDLIFNTRLMKVIRTVEYISIPAYLYYYIPRMGERLLRDPYKRYEYLTLGRETLDSLIESKSEGQRRESYMRQHKINLIEILVQDCFVLQDAGKFNKQMRSFLEHWTKENQILDFISMKDCNSLKRKIYYLIVKYKMWTGIGVICYLKKK